jgi:hypothetical protein
VELGEPTRVCIGGRYSEQNNPSLEALLAVIDEVERLIQAGESSEVARLHFGPHLETSFRVQDVLGSASALSWPMALTRYASSGRGE